VKPRKTSSLGRHCQSASLTSSTWRSRIITASMASHEKPRKSRDWPIAEQAGGIIIWGDKVVLRLTGSGHLVFPKGHIEPGETPEQTAIREIEEECGLITQIVGVAGAISFKKGHSMLRVTYYLMTVTGESDDIDEHLGIDTFPVPVDWAANLLTFKNIRKLLMGVSPQVERMVAAPAR
jgi:8-oxo-dGTP pyrophosphatase MutT (NUDIX family)